MNDRTGELALDVAFVQFDGPPPVALMLSYNGAALPPRSRVDGWQRPTLLGFESSTTRAYAGYGAGVADADFSANVFDGWGYPKECGYWFCAADTPSTDPVFVPNISEYGRGFVGRMRERGYVGPAMPYGNPRAVEAAAAGVRAAGSVSLRWGVGTWGYGEGGGANQPPASADVELLQSGNTPAPIPATDLDWLYVPVAVFAAYNGPAGPLPPAPSAAILGENMQIIAGSDPFGGSIAILVDDGLLLREWKADAAGTVLGAPKAAYDWKSEPGHGAVQMTVLGTDVELWARVYDHYTNPPAGGGGGGGATSDQVHAAVRAELDATKLVKV